MTEYPVPTAGAAPDGIVTGPDGALWFVEQFGNKVGRITTSGIITEFPGAGTEPLVITPGPDHALWFTAYASNAIARAPRVRPRLDRQFRRQYFNNQFRPGGRPVRDLEHPRRSYRSPQKGDSARCPAASVLRELWSVPEQGQRDRYVSFI